MVNEDLYLSAKEMAELAKVSPRSVQTWAEKGLLQKRGRDEYSARSMIEHLASKQSAAKDLASLKAEKLSIDIEVRKVELAMIERDLRIKDGSLLDQEEVYLAMSSILISCRNRILGIPSKLALQLSGIGDAFQIQGLLSEELEGALTELAQELSEDGNDDAKN